MKNLTSIVMISIVATSILSSLVTFGLVKAFDTKAEPVATQEKTEKSDFDYALDYYTGAAKALQSPHGLRLKIDEGNDSFVLVDVRKQNFYEEGHIVGAINIPGDQTPDDLLQAFKDLKEENKGKEVILYCYSTSCLNGRKIASFLLKNDVFVKELSVGYNEWEQSHEIWNYPGEEYNIEDYIVTGSEPGTFEPKTPAKNVECGSDIFAC